MMDSDYTIVIGTKEEEVVETGSFRSRPNVIFERGLALGRIWENGRSNSLTIFNENISENMSDINNVGWYPVEMIRGDELGEILFKESCKAGLCQLE